MSIEVSDVRSNPKDQIAHAAEVIGKSQHRRKVFIAIYRGKKRVKTVSDISEETGLNNIRVLQEALVLSNNDIVRKVKVGKETGYEKYPFYSQNKEKVLKLAGNKKALQEFPTKTNPRTTITAEVTVTIPKPKVRIEQLTVDDIDSFEKVRGLQTTEMPSPISEKTFKEGLKRILGEEGSFQDWGGETDDMFSTRMVLRGSRVAVAFGLKGRGTSGRLTPGKMGKNGDQIQRLFSAPADVFFVQYWAQVDESVYEEMKAFATMKSVLEDRTIHFGVIDGQDTQRLRHAYSEKFALQ